MSAGSGPELTLDSVSPRAARPPVFCLYLSVLTPEDQILPASLRSQQGRHDYACFIDGNTRSLEG